MTGLIRTVEGEDRYFLDGVPVTREMYDAYFPSKLFPVRSRLTKDEIEEFVRAAGLAEIPPELKKRLPRGYPIKSVALAVHPKDVEKAQEVSVRLGVPTEYTAGGRPILRDAAHRRAFLKATGHHDRNSYNGY